MANTRSRPDVNRAEIIRLTRRYGGDYEVYHSARLMRLIAVIGEGLSYDSDVVWVAAYLHDWGACPKWVKPGVNHSYRSKQLAEEYMAKAGYPRPFIDAVLEAIEFHHGGSADRSVEAILLSDADALDGLGVTGLLKEYAMVPTQLKGDYSLPVDGGMRGAFDRARIRRENNVAILRLEKSRRLAAERVRQMEAVFAALEHETEGLF